MDPVTLLLILGGAALFMNMGGKKKKSGTGQYTNLPPGDYPIRVGQELHLKLPRAAGYWRKVPIGSPGGDVKVFARAGDPLDVLRVEGKSAGPVKVEVYADEQRTDLVAEYMFEVVTQVSTTPKPAGNTATLTVK